MNIREYKDGVIKLFQTLTPTHAQWEELAEAILTASENEEGSTVWEIDKTVMGLKDEVLP